MVKILMCTWLYSVSMVVCYGVHVATGNFSSNHGKENFEAKASVGTGSLVALLSCISLCAIMMHYMGLQQSFEHMNALCEMDTYDGHIFGVCAGLC